MLFHLQLYPIEIAKEVDMTELVQLIRADRLIGIMLTEYREVVLAGTHGRHARTGEGNFARGSKENRHINAVLLTALMPQVQQRVRRIGQIMDTVGVIPENLEIGRRRLQSGEPADGFIRIRNACWVGIFRYAPNAFDGRIVFDQ